MKYECEICGRELCEYNQDVCNGCSKRINADQKRIKELEAEGHNSHCACRQVWGDGECECNLYAKGYDPYAWMKGKKVIVMRDWWDISKRLRRHLMTSPSVYGYKWSAQCGNWVIIIVRLHDVYKKINL